MAVNRTFESRCMMACDFEYLVLFWNKPEASIQNSSVSWWRITDSSLSMDKVWVLLCSQKVPSMNFTLADSWYPPSFLYRNSSGKVFHRYHELLLKGLRNPLKFEISETAGILHPFSAIRLYQASSLRTIILIVLF